MTDHHLASDPDSLIGHSVSVWLSHWLISGHQQHIAEYCSVEGLDSSQRRPRGNEVILHW